MSNTGDSALKGKNEWIENLHTFTVTTQTSVVASGMMVSVIRAGQNDAEKTVKDTGDAGWKVSRGDKIKVYNADVRFE